MMPSYIINKILFDYSTLSDEEIIFLTNQLPNKMIRWLGSNHPDNRIRKIFFRHTNISIGENVVILLNFFVVDDYEPLLTIGNRVSIAPNVTIICSSSPNNSILRNNPYVEQNVIKKEKVTISDDVWIGTNAVILPGIFIGECSIIGAGSIVTKNVDPYTIVAGNPAMPIRKIDPIEYYHG